jgi:adenylate cyclase
LIYRHENVAQQLPLLTPMRNDSALAEVVDKGESMEFRRAACLYADVSGYCRLINRDVQATVRLLRAYRETMTRTVGRHGGRVVDVAGDSLLAEFPTAEAAVRAGIEIQRAVEARNRSLPADDQLRFRIGIELGEVLVTDGGIYGDCVNIAARVQEVAAPGQICVAGGAYDDIDPAIVATHFEYLGKRFMKNVDMPQRVYGVE